MQGIIAINNEKIYKELKNEKNIKLISNDILYKEGVLEILEKNNNIDFIIINEDLNGQIKVEKLIKKIKIINSKINIIIILNKKDLIKEEYLLKNKIKFIYLEKVTVEKIVYEISEKILSKNKVIAVIGSRGSGKTITTIILSNLIFKYKNKKTLIVKDYTIDKTKIINEINNMKKQYNYIFIEIQNLNNYKFYEKIVDENILMLNPNILEINKIKKFIFNNNVQMKTILNNYNENAINEKILKNIFKDKIKKIAKIKYNENYNLIINNNFNINYLDKQTKRKYLKIIEKIK